MPLKAIIEKGNSLRQIYLYIFSQDSLYFVKCKSYIISREPRKKSQIHERSTSRGNEPMGRALWLKNGLSFVLKPRLIVLVKQKGFTCIKQFAMLHFQVKKLFS